MMRSLPLLLAAAVVLFVASPAEAGQTPVAVVDLLEESEMYDGREVVLTGELVGDYGFRADATVWSQLNDDSYATAPPLEGGKLTGSNIGVGVHAREELFRDLDAPGGYGTRGPVVAMVGVWKHHDPARGGESYLEVASLTVLEPGRPISEDLNPWVLGAGIVSAGIALLLGLRARRRAGN